MTTVDEIPSRNEVWILHDIDGPHPLESARNAGLKFFTWGPLPKNAVFNLDNKQVCTVAELRPEEERHVDQ